MNSALLPPSYLTPTPFRRDASTPKTSQDFGLGGRARKTGLSSRYSEARFPSLVPPFRKVPPTYDLHGCLQEAQKISQSPAIEAARGHRVMNVRRFKTANNNHNWGVSIFGADSRRLNLQFFLSFISLVHIAVITYPQAAIKD